MAQGNLNLSAKMAPVKSAGNMRYSDDLKGWITNDFSGG
jgi:hypothetical protein